MNNIIHIIDVGIGNVGSLKNSLTNLGYDSCTTQSLDVLVNSSTVIMPGNGNFGAVADRLKQFKLWEYLKSLPNKEVKFLGICVGMQLLFQDSEEVSESGSKASGLGILSGSVVYLHDETSGPPLPQVGWNAVNFSGENSYLSSDYYFVNSLGVKDTDNDIVLARSCYGQNFISAVTKKNIYGVQFHPEKSTLAGKAFLEWFLKRETIK